MSDASFFRSESNVLKTLAAAAAASEIQQLASGRAAVKIGEDANAAGEQTAWNTSGQYAVTKATGVVLLDGGRVYWDHGANKATFRPVNDRDFYLGVCVGDAASSADTCIVNLNILPAYEIELTKGVWTTEATDGLGVTLLPGGGVQLAFDAVNEAAQAAIYSERTLPVVLANPILETRVAVFDKGDDAALDIDIGLATGPHATDFESVNEFVAFHWDGNDLSIRGHSDDGTTDVAPADSGVDAADDTYVELWIDCRDPSDCKLYIDAVRVLENTTFVLTTGTVRAVCEIEKTANDTSADFRVDFLRVRIAEQ